MIRQSSTLAEAGPGAIRERQAASAVLLKKIRLVSPRTHQNSPSVLAHPRLREFYPELLFILYSTIRASVPMMKAAMEVSRARSAFDPVAAELAPYYEIHRAEELHHDEWMLEDMEALGMDREETLKRLPPAELAAAVGAQYYWIQYCHPAALLGYMAALETDPAPAEVVKKAAAESGLPPAVFRTLLIHTEHDVGHCEDLLRLIDRLPLEPYHVKLISVSAMQIAAAYEEAALSVLPD